VPVPLQGRIHQHAIEAALVALDPAVRLAGEKAGLDVVETGLPETLGGPLEATFHDVAGDDVALVGHLRGDGQRLAPGPGAEVDHALARPGVDQHRHELRALVLDLGLAALQHRQAPERKAFVHANPVGSQGRRLRPHAEFLQRGKHRLARRSDRIDPQVERRRLQQRGHLLGECRPEPAPQRPRRPGRAFEAHLIRHGGMVDRMALQPGHQRLLPVRQARGRKLRAIEQALDLLRSLAVLQHQPCKQPVARRIFVPLPLEPPA
jgi:hypothetical protein